MSKPKKDNGGRKVSGEKKRKQNWMWLEQVYYKLDEQEKRIKDLETKVAELESHDTEWFVLEGIPEELKKNLKIHISRLKKDQV